MQNHRQIVAGIALAGLLAWPDPGAAAPPVSNVIRTVDVADRDGAVEVEIRATRAPSYTVFKLQDPPRLVVDLSGGDVSGVASPIRVDRGGVTSVTTAQYQDEKTSVGRVVIALDAAARYEVAPQGETVRVRVLPGVAAREAQPPLTPAAVAAAVEPPVATLVEPTPAPRPPPPPRATTTSCSGASTRPVRRSRQRP